MRDLTMIKALILSTVLFLSALYADNPRQTVTKELLSKTMSGGITTLDWVVRYESNSSIPLEDVVITDNFSSAQSYVPSTEAHPNGWSVMQNPNQFIWEISKANEYSKVFPNKIGSIEITDNGDGWAPILYTSTSGDKRIYFINHHSNADKYVFKCNGSCIGTWPKKLIDGDSGSTETSPTSYATETVTIGTNLYYPVTRTNDSGIGCYNMETDSECGYISLSTLGNGSGAMDTIVLDGMAKVGNSLYVMDGNSKVYKVNVASGGTMSLGGDFDMTSIGMGTGSRIENVSSYNIKVYGIDSKVDGTKIYFIKGIDRQIGCFDTTSMTDCSGWGGIKTLSYINKIGTNTLFYYDTSMNVTAICSVKNTTSSFKCLDINSGTVVSKTNIFTSNLLISPYGTGTEITVGTKTYFPDLQKNNLRCYDWSTTSPCTPALINDGVTGNAENYAISADNNGCAWVYGDIINSTLTSLLWSFDTATGASPCESEGKNLIIDDTYDASKNWCASEDVEWRYTQFKINGLTANMFTDLNITFYDANGNVIKTATLPSNAVSYSQGLFTAPFVEGEPIHYKIEGTRNPAYEGNRPAPVITIGVDGPPREFCFKTTVPCPVTGDITNHVEVQLKGEHSIDSSADVVENAAALCKEVLPEPPRQCLNAEPELKCTKTGWTVDLGTFTPSTYDASNTDMNVLAPTGATVTKWGNTWHVNGVSPGNTLSLSMQGVQQGAGKFEGGDLCCNGETNITIPTGETCDVEEPHIYIRKLYDATTHVFDLNVRIMNTIYAPQVLTVSDTLPSGITITGIDPRSTAEWSCTNSFPISGPATINCFYTGAMPATGIKDLYLMSTVDNSQMPAENCADSGVVGTDGSTVYTNPMMHHCVTIDKEDENETDNNNTVPTDVNETNTSCSDTQILVDGVCEDLPVDPCSSGQQMVDEQCSEMPEINCQSNIVLVVDRSDSITNSGAVRNTIQAFLDRFRGNGSQAAIIYFDTTATIVRPMSLINVGDMAPYYNPVTGGLTNWEDALEQARSIVSSGDIVFFITDGQPNRYLDTSGNVAPTGVPPAANTPALITLENLATQKAAVVANQIKAMGAKIISVGVGNIASSTNAIPHLNAIASTPSDINVQEFANLESMAEGYASAACPTPLFFTKEFRYGTMQYDGCRRMFIAESTPSNAVVLRVQNTSSTSVSAVVVRDVLPVGLTSPTSFTPSTGTASALGNTISWNVGTLGANTTESLQFDVTVPVVQAGECQDIHNFAEVIAATGVDVTPLLPDAQLGPVNPNEMDESRACLRICKRSEPVACNPETDSNHCLRVVKTQLPGEGNCIAGGECRYRIGIYNKALVPYTGTLNISDFMTPSSASSSITITAQGNAPDPLCSPTPTSIPFSCVQTQDIPPAPNVNSTTGWYYNVVMSTTPQNATKNCFKVNGAERCFNFPSTKSMESQILKVEKPQLTLKKSAPKECKAGSKCTFSLKVTNKGIKTYSGPLTIKDVPREFVGKLVRSSPRGWRCKTSRKAYVCTNPKVTLKAGERTTVKLTVRIPQRAKGYLNNCAKLDFPKGRGKIKVIQKMLLQNGFSPNGIDGGMGRGTKKALKAYMRSKGIKSQKEAMKLLFNSFPHAISKNSCVKVKIKKSKLKCRKYEKIVGEKCKPLCKKWQHWNGKHCVTCQKGTKWDTRKKECKEIKCAKGLKILKGKCVKEGKAKCIPFITHYSTLLGICVPNISIGIGGGGKSPKGDNSHAGY